MDVENVTRALVARVDALDVTTDRHDTELTAIKKELVGIKVGLPTALKAPVRQPPGMRGQQATGPSGQTNWLAVRDPDTAVRILRDAAAFAENEIPWLTGHRLEACWAWHPIVIIELIALKAQYVFSYEQDAPGAVSDFLTRWLLTFNKRVSDAMKNGTNCNSTEHYVNGEPYRIVPSRRDEIAVWWATSRIGEMPGLEKG